MIFFHAYPVLFVAAGAKIAPRARRTMAIALAAALVAMSFRNHVLLMGGPWWSWTINFTHFTLEALGALLAVVYIFWSEKSLGLEPPSKNWVEQISGSLADIPEDDYQQFLQCCETVRHGDSARQSA